ncbi:hypothetical protein PAU_01346 [Photorhabdus asymbiotica]|uniref:Uncharacterized protein n=1 Tax=Photorhabdus asymbiotica subsp. asymbiotica (strain ATCC 43949 / 3105-77) TaxID=553480 RepID=C7BRN7_PHOAA|nr:hypothetical protein PAU_01346 [Photorhabdus asymbiotica]
MLSVPFRTGKSIKSYSTLVPMLYLIIFSYDLIVSLIKKQYDCFFCDHFVWGILRDDNLIIGNNYLWLFTASVS